jgi:hypothetical protein
MMSRRSRQQPRPEILRNAIKSTSRCMFDTIFYFAIFYFAIDLSSLRDKIANIMFSQIALPRSRRMLPTSHRDGRELCFG